MRSIKTNLALGVASAALAIGISSQARADCTTDGSTTTCSNTVTAADVNVAVNGVAGDDVTVKLDASAIVTNPGGSIYPTKQGAVAIDNGGAIGASDSPVNIFYVGTIGSDANSFDLKNIGAINGSVFAGSVGGTVDIVNSGTITLGVTGSARGNVSIVTDGDVGTRGTSDVPSALRNVTATSSHVPAATVETTTDTVNGVTTTITTSTRNATGGTASVTVGEAAATGTVAVTGEAGATAQINGSVGAEDQIVSVRATSQSSGGKVAWKDTEVSGGDVTENSYHQETSTSGGAATVTVASTGSVSGAAVATGLSAATVKIDGTVGVEGGNLTSSATASGTSSVSDNNTRVAVDGSSYVYEVIQKNSRTGGDAAIEVGADAVVNGNLSARADGNAGVTNAGEVLGDVTARAQEYISIADLSYKSEDTYETTATGSVASTSDVYNSVSTYAGKAATANNLADAVIDGSVSVTGLSGATAANAGAIGGNVTLTSAATETQTGYDYSTTNTYVTDPVAGDLLTATADTGSSATHSRALGGAAALDNAATGEIEGNVSISGLAGATLANAGTIEGNATLSSTGSDYSNVVSDVSGSTRSVDAGASYLTNETGNKETVVTTTPKGGSALLTNAASGKIGSGPGNSVWLTAGTDATVENAGLIDAYVSLNARSISSSQTTKTGYTRDYDADGQTASADSFGQAVSTAATGGSASLTNAAGGLIGKAQDSPVGVSLAADKDATLTNAGRINGGVSLVATSTSSASEETSESTATYDPLTGDVLTSSYTEATAGASEATGGAAKLDNKAGAIIVGGATLSANGDITIANAGLVTGQTYAATIGASTSSTTAGSGEYARAADGSYTSSAASSSATSSMPTGGDINGTYSGVNGAYQYAPTGASDGTVTQQAAGNSTAIVTGTIIGGFNGNASATSQESSSEDASTSSFTPASATAPKDVEQEQSSSSSTSKQSFVGGNSTLAVNGGTITGTAALTADGNASAALGNGAAIEGSLSLYVNDSAAYEYAGSSTSAETYEDGELVAAQYDSVEDSSWTSGTGTTTATIGEATVGGNVSLQGSAGAVDLSLSADGEVGGSATVNAYASDYQSHETSSTTVTADGSTGTESLTYSYTATGGNVTATVAGVIGNGLDGAQEDGEYGGYGSLSLSTNKGDATATVTGQVGNGISLLARGTDSTVSTTSSYIDGEVSSTSQSQTITVTGGKATLAIDSATGETPVNFGNISVGGLGGSTVTISADSTVLARPAGASLQVGRIDYDSASTSQAEYPVDGLGSSTTSYGLTAVGGASVLTNAGQIGYDGGTAYGGTAASVTVQSLTSATATNSASGSIYGSISVRSIAGNTLSETVSLNLGDVTRTDTTTTTYTAVGGAASLTNARLIAGSAYVAGATGTVVNNGVIRGNISAGQSVSNHVTRTVNTVSQIGTPELVSVNELFNQTYTINQNGLLGGSVTVYGALGPIEDADGEPVQTSNIVATVNLNSGSVTGGGVYAQYDEETGERLTTTNVNLVGQGWLGLSQAGSDALEDAFAAYDPRIEAWESLDEYVGGARVVGVNRLTKSGNGTFTIVGSAYVPANNVDPVAYYTLDVGEFVINAGEIQLATSGDGEFGIRGNLTNNASLVLGTRVDISQPPFASNLTSTGTQGVEGVAIVQKGNFTQSSSGSLTIGLLPALVRVTDPSVGSTVLSTEPLATQQVLYSKGLFTTPENAYGAVFADLSPSSVQVEGNLVLNGTINLLTPTGGLFTNGQSIDLFDVSGTVSESATAVSSAPNNFVSFDVVTKAGGSGTLVQVVASRKGYETAAGTSNGAAAGAALTAALPDVVSALTADAAGEGVFSSVAQFSLTQDLATVLAGLDSQLSAAQAGKALDELGGGSYYGSLAAVRTTSPFVDVLSNRRLPDDARGFNLWLQPTGDFARFDGSTVTGASRIRADNYGLAGGFGVATGHGEFGAGFAYGRVDSHSDDGLATASADSYMFGIYARQGIDRFTVSGDLVFGWSNWKATRAIPTLSRQATAKFDSKEVRGDLRVEYDFDLNGATVSPFGQVEIRHYRFDGFAEEGAGAVGLAVAERSRTVFTPAIGVKVGTEWELDLAKLRPEASISYNFKGGLRTDRTVAFLGAPDESFRLQGVDPEGFVNFQLGLFADIGDSSGAYVRGGYSTGGGNNVAAIRAGIVIGF